MHQLLALCCLALPLAGLDLTSFTPFTGTEEQVTVFSFEDLLARATPAEAFDRFVVFDVDTDGTVSVGPSATGPWSTITVNHAFVSGEYLRYVPNTNIQGSQVILTVKGGIGATLTSLCNITVSLANTPDAITATGGAHVFPQPGAGPVVTEDTTYTFTHAALASALTIVEPDPEPYSLIITAVLGGTLRNGADQAITLPYTVASGGSVRWTPPLDAYTKSGEDPLPVLRAYGRTDANGQRTVSTELRTAIAGVTDDLGGSLTLTGFTDITVVRGITRTMTYEELHRHAVGTNDVDRVGQINLDIQSSALDGSIARVFFPDGSLRQEQPLPGLITISDQESLHLLTESNAPLGRHSTLIVSLSRPGYLSDLVTGAIVVQAPGAPGGGSTGGGGSAGGCAAGTGGLILIGGIGLGLGCRRRRSWHG